MGAGYELALDISELLQPFDEWVVHIVTCSADSILAQDQEADD